MACSENNIINQAYFKQMLYRRIQLAAAMYVIKSTPRGKIPEVHAFDLQQKLKIRWLNITSLQENRVDQHILAQQQTALSARLESVASQDLRRFLEGNFLNPQRCLQDDIQEEKNRACVYFNNEVTSKDKILANAKFVQAIIQLISLAESQSTVPMQQYIGSLAKLKQHMEHFSCSVKDELQLEASSDDSGFQNAEDCNAIELPRQGKSPSSTTGVASSMLLYIIHSCSADQLVQRSIQAVLGQLKQAAMETNFEEAVNQWKGSIYQQALGALHSVIGKHLIRSDITNSCNGLCFSFIQELIMDIIKKKVSKKMNHLTQENQILLLLQLCDGTNLWFNTLEFTLSHIGELANTIRNQIKTEDESPSGFKRHSEIQLVEQSFFLFRLLKAFLAGASRQKESINEGHCDSRETGNQVTANSVAALWRKRFDDQKVHHKKPSKVKIGIVKTQVVFQFDARHWKYLLEEFFGQVLYGHPTIAVIIHQCIELLSIYIQLLTE